MPHAPKTTWILISDGMHARILRQEAAGANLEPALEEEMYDPAAHGFSRDLKSDHPGRAFDTGSGARHALEPRHDPHQYEKFLFARKVAQLMSNAARRHEFQRLILVAPLKMLGDLRSELDEHAAKLVVGDLAKDLVRVPLHELQAHFTEVLTV